MPKPYNPHDKLMIKAKIEGFRARSVYKLEELDKKFRLFRMGQKVLDLGAFPGSWSQYISSKIGDQGMVVAIDLQKIAPISDNVIIKQADILDLELTSKIINEVGIDNFDLVVSDLAPNTTGIKHADHVRSIELSTGVLEIAKKYLDPKGKMIIKVFPGVNLYPLKKEIGKYFRVVNEIKVKSSRDRSSEVYLVCH